MEYNIQKSLRTKNVLEFYSRTFAEKVDLEGNINGFFDADDTTGSTLALRMRLYVAYALLFDETQDSIDKANVIISNSDFVPGHFTPMICAQILLKHKEKLSRDNYKVLYDYLEVCIEGIINDKECEFVGVNDNFPCMACFEGIIGGSIVGNASAMEWGKNNLEKALKMLNRRGLSSEHTSPTYSPIQILAIAEIVNYTDDEETKTKALELENRLALSILSFYHPETGKMSGPYSRAYEVDSVGGIHMIDYWLYIILGERTISALEETFNKNKISKIFHGSQWFAAVQFVWLAACQYHVSERIINDAINRKFPYEVKASCEYSSSRDDLKDGDTDTLYPACENQVSCYMTKEYAVGISKIPFHSGIQTDSFHFLCKKKDIITHSSDLQAIFLRYIVNNTMKTVKETQWDRGRKIGLQNNNIGFIGYRPTKRIVGSKVHSMKLSIIIPTIYDNEIDIIQMDSSTYIRVHNTYIAFYALDKRKKIEIEKYSDFKMISIYDYSGKEKTLTLEDYYNTANGIVFAVDTVDKCSFEEFAKRKVEINVEDFKTSHSRQTLLRNVFFKYNNEASIEIEYDVEGCGVKYSLADDKLCENIYFYDTEHGMLNSDTIKEVI